jgi:hypothetical protein
MGQFLSKAKLSGSISGRPIKVVATSTPGTTIHTAVSGSGDDNYDEIWLWAMNTDSADRKLTIEWGGQTAPDDLIEKTITLEGGLILVVPGLILQGGLVVTAFAATANVVLLLGHVNKIRPT